MPQDPTSLDALVDIVVPPAAPWWPPAPGWYLVIGAFVVLAIWQAARAWLRWRANAYRREALREIDAIALSARVDPQSWHDLPPLLKRTALSAWPREQVASLAGDEWLAFLDGSLGGNDFTAGPGRLIVDLSYNPSAGKSLSPRQADALLALTRRWVERHVARREGPC